jgi:hypothetical protein
MYDYEPSESVNKCIWLAKFRSKEKFHILTLLLRDFDQPIEKNLFGENRKVRAILQNIFVQILVDDLNGHVGINPIFFLGLKEKMLK